MAGEINPQLLQFLVTKMGERVTPDVIQGFLLGLGAQNLSKMMKPKQPPVPKNPQAGGQVSINRNVPGPGPLRSGTTPQQIQALAMLLASPQMGMQLSKLPAVPPRRSSPAVGIPGVKGPTFG